MPTPRGPAGVKRAKSHPRPARLSHHQPRAPKQLTAVSAQASGGKGNRGGRLERPAAGRQQSTPSGQNTNCQSNFLLFPAIPGQVARCDDTISCVQWKDGHVEQQPPGAVAFPRRGLWSPQTDDAGSGMRTYFIRPPHARLGPLDVGRVIQKAAPGLSGRLNSRCPEDWQLCPLRE